MTTQIKPPAKDLYEDDFYVWAQSQAALLREQRFADLDLANLIEEVEDLAGSLRRSVRSRARRIMEHLLKLQFTPAQDPRPGWRETVRTQHSDLRDDLTPTLRRELATELAEVYERACHAAAGSLQDHGDTAAAAALPTACPYDNDRITGDWLP